VGYGRHCCPDENGPDDAADPAATGTDARPDREDASITERAADQNLTEPDAGAEPEAADIADEDALVLTTVAVPYGDRLTTYDAAGSGIIWRIPAELAARVGNGSLPRREAGEGVSTQCLVVDQQRLVLRGLDADEWSVSMLDEGALPVPPIEFRERIRLILIAAARRGESVVFTRPGLLELAIPCVRASVVQDETGAWLSVVEAFPSVTAEGWSDAEEDDGMSRKTAIADEQTMAGAAALMVMAAQTFAPGPEQIGLYFEATPDGPWTDDP
jgi:hypothetical protein